MIISYNLILFHCEQKSEPDDFNTREANAHWIFTALYGIAWLELLSGIMWVSIFSCKMNVQ